MEVERCTDVGAFARAVRPLLLRDEARHNQLLGVLGGLENGTYDAAAAWPVTVTDRGGVVAVALRTPPWPWLFGWLAPTPLDAGQAEEVVQRLASWGAGFPAVTSDPSSARRLAQAWCARHGGDARRTMAMRIMEATAVALPVPWPPGHPRPATRADAPRIRAWGYAFAREALPGDDPDRFAAAQVRHLATGQFRYSLWLDREPVAMAAIGAPTGTGERIGGVYTPPRWRGRGYAGALVAAMTREGFDRGLERVLLYTDATNPISNRLYARVGYRDVGAAERWDVT